MKLEQGDEKISLMCMEKVLIPDGPEMQQRILRRTSFGGSSSSLRRSSVSSKDIQAMQAALAVSSFS
ncbi:unnamed protein product [Nippostrongylus brasiliensis]|uniref:Protein kinase domain-containing protein n=1 Tax=Nippostrongylus brasiliensis TaxID=27835 RepID=A0A0N4YBF1_NIPBR|nr:unnamed protein product [Nippostrongylus brasiliensis]